MKKNRFVLAWFLEDLTMGARIGDYRKKASALRQLKRLQQKGRKDIYLNVILWAK